MSTNKIIGPDGVQQLYPTAQGGTEFFLNQTDPYNGGAYTSRATAQFNISYGQANTFPFTTSKDPSGLVFFNTTGSPITYNSGGNGRSVRLDCFPDGGRNANKTSYSWQNNPGYLYTDKGIGSAEMTAFIRVHGDLGKHQSYAFKMGGRDEDAIRSLFEMVYPTATHSDIQCNYNYAHFPYVNVTPVHVIPNPPKLADDGKWRGVKVVHKIAADRKSSDWEMWVDIDPFDGNGKPNNNWVLAATYHDVGTSGYNNVPTTWKCHKDLVRIDGFANVDFTLLSDREIDFGSAPPPPPPPPICPAGQHLDPLTNTCVPDSPPPPPPVCPPGQHLEGNICVPDVVPPLSARKQTRHTSTAGVDVPDQFWTIDSDTGPIPGPSPVPGPLPIAGVTSIGAETGNPATNAVDGDLTTRWSNNGAGSWIQLDLGIVCDLTSVDIAWFKGDTRTANFTIDISEDARRFTNVLTGVSNGTTLSLQPNPVTGKAKLVKITCNGNSVNTWASITEIVVKGAPSGPNPTPTGVQAVITAPAQTASAGQLVSLDGSLSKGDIRAFQWSQTSGPAVSLTTPTTSKTSFIAPTVSATTPFGFSLRVTDASGQTSTANAIVTITGSTPPAPCPTGFHKDANGNCVPDTPTCPSGQHLDPVTNTCVPDVIPPSGNLDQFGYQKIYADRQGTYNNWVQTTASDPRFFEGRVADAGNGWLKNAGGNTQIRIEVLSDITANEQTVDTFDVGKCIAKGYIYKPIDSPDGKGDWGDFEMTWRVRGQAGTGTHNGECHNELVPGGYRQTNDSTMVGKDKAVPASCEAMSYHFNFYPLTGRVKYEKDSQHTSGYTKNDPEKTNAISKFDNNQEIIQKAVFYRVSNGVKLESYVDESGIGKQFKKVLEFIDDGTWGPTRGGNAPCHCGEFPILSMGRIALGYRGDNWNTFEFKDASIRSIDATKPLHASASTKAPKERMVYEEIDRT